MLETLTGTERALLAEVALHGPLSKKRLASLLGLSPGSITRNAALLLDKGMIGVDAEPTPHGRGRPEQPLRVSHHYCQVAGIKVTQDRLYGVISALDGTPLARRESRVDSTEPHAIVEQIARMTSTLGNGEGMQPPAALGVGIGGHKIGDTMTSSLLGWHRFPLRETLEQRLGMPVVAESDVVALITGQRIFGAARDADNFALVTVGVGIGYGLVAHNSIVRSPSGQLGSLTHIPLGIGGSVCEEGHIGCAESLLITKALENKAFLAFEKRLTFPELLAAVSGSQRARVIVAEAAQALGKLVSIIENIALPARVLLTGDGIGMIDSCPNDFRRGLHEFRSVDHSPVPIKVLDEGFSIWADGAAALAIEALLRP